MAQVHHRLGRLGDEKLAGTGLRIRHHGPLRGLRDLGPGAQQRLVASLAITGPTASQPVREWWTPGPYAAGAKTPTTRHALELTETGRGHPAVAADALNLLEALTAALLGPGGADGMRPLPLRLLHPAAHAG
ncbi:hypothetical protein ACQSMD_24385 [Streptomyces flavovirens]|uniref:hypothetical protein n=1 Tax=Streptomyces flavovirens TaxID=52258 RepID=UPI003D13E0E0